MMISSRSAAMEQQQHQHQQVAASNSARPYAAAPSYPSYQDGHHHGMIPIPCRRTATGEQPPPHPQNVLQTKQMLYCNEEMPKDFVDPTLFSRLILPLPTPPLSPPPGVTGHDDGHADKHADKHADGHADQHEQQPPSPFGLAPPQQPPPPLHQYQSLSLPESTPYEVVQHSHHPQQPTSLHDHGYYHLHQHCQSRSGLQQAQRDDSWKKRFLELKEFQAKYGHVNVVETSGPLGKWATVQRVSFKKGKLTDDRIDKLLSVGFSFKVHAQTWEKQLEELKKFKAEHGHFRVPEKGKDAALYKWIHKQRFNFRKGCLSDYRSKKLESIGYSFEIIAPAWEKKFEELKAFKAEHGHLRVSSTKDSASYYWIRGQRALFKKGSLLDGRRRKLESIGLSFEMIAPTREKPFEELLQVQEQQQVSVPPRSPPVVVVPEPEPVPVPVIEHHEKEEEEEAEVEVTRRAPKQRDIIAEETFPGDRISKLTTAGLLLLREQGITVKRKRCHKKTTENDNGDGDDVVSSLEHSSDSRLDSSVQDDDEEKPLKKRLLDCTNRQQFRASSSSQLGLPAELVHRCKKNTVDLIPSKEDGEETAAKKAGDHKNLQQPSSGHGSQQWSPIQAVFAMMRKPEDE